MIIQFDDREGKAIEAMMLLVDEKITMLRTRLDEGDYVWNKVVVERKQIDDFCMSMMDGRMEKQVEAMKEKYKHVFIIIVGHIKDRTSEIHEHSVLGMIVSLVIKHKVNVLMVDDNFQFLYMIKRIFERYEEMENGKV